MSTPTDHTPHDPEFYALDMMAAQLEAHGEGKNAEGRETIAFVRELSRIRKELYRALKLREDNPNRKFFIRILDKRFADFKKQLDDEAAQIAATRKEVVDSKPTSAKTRKAYGIFLATAIATAFMAPILILAVAPISTPLLLISAVLVGASAGVSLGAGINWHRTQKNEGKQTAAYYDNTHRILRLTRLNELKQGVLDSVMKEWPVARTPIRGPKAQTPPTTEPHPSRQQESRLGTRAQPAQDSTTAPTSGVVIFANFGTQPTSGSPDPSPITSGDGSSGGAGATGSWDAAATPVTTPTPASAPEPTTPFTPDPPTFDFN